MIYVDTSVILVYTLNKTVEIERYKYVKKLFSKIKKNELIAITSLYSFQEVCLYAIDNSPSSDIGNEFSRLALYKILQTGIKVVPLLDRIERKTNIWRFKNLPDTSDLPHAITAFVYNCNSIVAYDNHFSYINDIVLHKRPDEIV